MRVEAIDVKEEWSIRDRCVGFDIDNSSHFIPTIMFQQLSKNHFQSDAREEYRWIVGQTFLSPLNRLFLPLVLIHSATENTTLFIGFII